MHTTIARTVAKNENTTIRRGLWLVGLLMAAGIGISGFSIASGLIVA